MTLLHVALSATVVLFFVCACPTVPSRWSPVRRLAALIHCVRKAFLSSNPLDDANPIDPARPDGG